MTKGVSVAEVTETDLEQLKPLLVELLESLRQSEAVDIHRGVRRCRRMLEDPTHSLLVAKAGGCLVGFVHVSFRQTILHGDPSGLIDELVVAKDWRGRGIGKELVGAAMQACRDLECCEVEVSTEKANVKARKFYKACGFAEDAVLLEQQLEASIGG